MSVSSDSDCDIMEQCTPPEIRKAATEATENLLPQKCKGRQRMEHEMGKRLEEQKIKEEARWREKVMIQRPIWQELNYSYEEELEMRLQLRRDEEKLRGQEHRHHMELMHGRVQQIPTLFERQSQMKAPKTKKELMQTLYDEINYSSNLKAETPEDNWGKLDRSVYCNKAIQAKFDENEKDFCECSEETE